MQLQDIKTGLKVQFVEIRKGKRVGLDKDIYTIVDINFNDWGTCEVLVECEGYEIYTTHDAIEVATDAAIKDWLTLKHNEQAMQEVNYEQITIFDILEVS